MQRKGHIYATVHIAGPAIEQQQRLLEMQDDPVILRTNGEADFENCGTPYLIIFPPYAFPRRTDTIRALCKKANAKTPVVDCAGVHVYFIKRKGDPDQESAMVPAAEASRLIDYSIEEATKRIAAWEAGRFNLDTCRAALDGAGLHKGAGAFRGRTSESLSLVIAAFNQIELTQQCVESILADYPRAEIILVDNGSTDRTAAWAESQGIRVIRFEENRGVSKAWNAGLKAASGRVIGVLNNDTIINPGGLHYLSMEAQRVGIAAYQGGVLNSDINFVGHTFLADEADYADGCCILFRRGVWDSVGPFDETFSPAYWEDTDWGLRAKEKGFKWALCPGSLIHKGGGTAKSMGLRPLKQKNEAIGRERWKGKGIGETILIKRHAALGDIIMATAALSEFKRRRPFAKIHLLVDPVFLDTLAGLPCVDKVIAEPGGPYASTFDLDGAYERQEIAGDCIHPAIAFGRALGVSGTGPYCLPDVPPASDIPAGAVALGLRSGTRSKVNWGEARWIELVRSLPNERFITIDGEARPNLEVRGEYAGPRLYDEPNVIDRTGKTTAQDVMGIMKACRAAISVDTGALHLAAGAGLPVVAIVGSGPGWARAPLFGRSRVVQGSAPCFPCVYSSKCPRDRHCLDWLTGRDVTNAFNSLMGKASESDGRN